MRIDLKDQKGISVNEKISAITPIRMSSADRREQILDEAKKIVAMDGFLAITMKRLADEAKITRTLIYQQFGDLAGVLAALVEREFTKELSIYLRSTSMYPGGGVEQFVSVIGELLKGVDDNPAAWQLFLMTPDGAPEELHHRLTEGRAMVQTYLSDSLQSAAKKDPSIMINLDFELGAKSLGAVAESLLRLRLEDPERYSHERLLSHVRVLSELLFGAAAK